MDILSKQFLYMPSSSPTPPPSYTYEAYYINNGTMTSLGEITDLSKTFAPQDEFIYSDLYILEGNVYRGATKVTTSGNVTSLTGRCTSSSYFAFYVENGKLYSLNSSLNKSQVGTATDWIKVCGYAGSLFGSDRAFAEASDGLWYIQTSAQGQVSTLTGWSKITGYGNTGSANYYGYGINNGKLYYLYANGNGAIQQGTDTTWTDITGSYENGSWYGYGINAGKLYALSGAPTQIGSDTAWTKVSGTASSSAYSLGINGGKLYKISGKSATQIGSSTDWRGCSGFCLSSGTYALAYDSTALYNVLSGGTITKLMDGNWVYCGNNYSSSGYGIAIRRK